MNNKEILDNAPDGATHYEAHFSNYIKESDKKLEYLKFCSKFKEWDLCDANRLINIRSISDIKRIVELRAEIAELKKALSNLLIETSKVYSTSGGLAGAEIEAKAVLSRSEGE